MSSKLISLTKIREGDRLFRQAQRLDDQVRIPSLFALERILSMAKPTEKRPGRPQGAEPTVSIALRIPESMCHQLDAHVEHLEAETGLKASRTEVCRHALRLYLEDQPTSSKGSRQRKRARTPAKAAKG